MSERITWDEYAMRLAVDAARRSQDPYLHVGCCVLRKDHTVASLGYNGPPPGIEIDWTDRVAKNKRILHAEINCLRYVRPGEGYTLAVTHSPCPACFTAIASWGIKRILYQDLYHGSDPDMLKIAEEFGISMEKITLL